MNDAIAFFWKLRSAAALSELVMAILVIGIFDERGTTDCRPGLITFVERQRLLLFVTMPTM
jgi:hypothetical protein